jgi:excinuclease ABC subunit C
MSKVKEQAKKLPGAPGVYIFKDKNGKPLYVGRATSLKNRVANYFHTKDLRLIEMVSLAKNLAHKKTDTLLEAIILEANLIKKYWPKYNIKDKDNRSFAYIIFTEEDFPKPAIVRGSEIKNAGPGTEKNRFGPYQSYTILRQALKIIRRIFPYGTCKPNSGKACFDYQIGMCPGACIGAISRKEYAKNIRNIKLLLSGKNKTLIKKLQKENPEKAKALKHIQDVALLKDDNITQTNNPQRIEGYDISHFGGKETVGAMVVFKDGEPSNKDYRTFNIKEAPANDDLRALEEMMIRRLRHTEWPYPDLIMIDGGRPQVVFISRVLRKNKINIPLVGISKFSGDELVFPLGTKKENREEAATLKSILIKAREESHRFANRGRKRRKV